MSGRQRGEDLLEELGVAIPRARLDTLSRGTVAKVLLVAALAGEPDVVVLDQPFAALDAASRHSAAALVRRCADRGSAVLLAEHGGGVDLGVTRTVTLTGGRLLEDTSRGPTARWRLVLRGTDGRDREQVVTETDRDPVLLDALTRGERVLHVERQ